MTINQIVECPWEQSPPRSHGPTYLSSLNTYEAIDGNLSKWKWIWKLWLKWHHMIHLTWKCVEWGRWRGQTCINCFYILKRWTKRPELQKCLWSIIKGIGDNSSHITWSGVVQQFFLCEQLGIMQRRIEVIKHELPINKIN
jgi:hypothetical protein